MLYIEIMSADGTTVGTEALEEPIFVLYQEKNNLLIRCNEKKAQGIISSENENVVYQLENKEKIKSSDEELLVAKLISKEDYENLKAIFSDEKEDKKDDSSADVVPDESENSTMTSAQMRAKILSLTSDVQDLKEQNQMLTDCILDMSEKVYA